MGLDSKSHVGLMLCWYCLEEGTGVLLDKRLRDSLPNRAVYDMEPCHKCKGFMEQGIILIGATEESIAQIPSEQEHHQRQVDALPYHQRKNARPFVPNPHRTGHWFVVSEDFVKRNFNPQSLVDQILKYRWSFIDPEIGEMLKKQHEQQEAEVGQENEEEAGTGGVSDAPEDAV
jgi:hypothetical protein